MNRTNAILPIFSWLIISGAIRAQQSPSQPAPQTARTENLREAAGPESCAKETGVLFLIKEHGKYGYIDKTGQIVIRPQYDYAENFCEGLAVVGVSGTTTHFGVKHDEHSGGKYGYIDTNGKIIIQPQYDWAGGFREGLAPVAVGGKWKGYMHYGGQHGYINKTGKMAISARYSDAREFSGGLAVVGVGGKWEGGELIDVR